MLLRLMDHAAGGPSPKDDVESTGPLKSTETV